jgi:phospholipase/carboxylesterase
MIEPELLTFRNWTFRLHPAQSEHGRLLILIHGWMGDENSMWVLARGVSPEYSILAPRGFFPVPEGGYSWREIMPGTWGKASIEELRHSADEMLEFVDEWSASRCVDSAQFDLMGFSQGAALAYTLALLHPDRVRHIAGLAGFLPEDSDCYLDSKRLSGKLFFVSHGRQDSLISVERARSTVLRLKDIGAKVTYCESDSGHKVSRECIKAMVGFFES